MNSREALGLTFLANETNKTIKVLIPNDGRVEPVETFRVALTNAAGGAIIGSRSNATVRITDNDKGLQLELASYSVNEDDGPARIRVLRRDDGDFPVSVDYATSDVTAIVGSDYVAASGTLTFGPRETLRHVTTALLNDASHEPSKSFRITLSNPTGGSVLGTPVASTVTITDTDELVQLQTASITNREDAALIRAAVIRGENAVASTVYVATADGTAIAGHDYVGMTNTLSFLPGERVKFIDVAVLKDDLKETSETFRISLSNPTGGAVLGPRRTMTVTMLDNDPGVGFERSAFSVWEKVPALTLNVVRGGDGWLAPFTVDYQTADGTAVGGVDYQAASGTLSFASNEIVKGNPLALVRDPAPESVKSFTVTLSNLTGEIPMGRSTCQVSIADASQGNVESVQPTLRAGIEFNTGLAEVSWAGSAALSWAASAAGPWEQVGSRSSPLLTRADLPGVFYQLRSSRTARLYVPSGYNDLSPMPLVLVLHGYSGDAAGYLDYFRIEPLAETRGFLVCHPEGTVDSQGWRFWNATEACCDFYGSGVDDSA